MAFQTSMGTGQESLIQTLSRRGFLKTLFAGVGLCLSYGTLAALALRFLYPGGAKARRKMFLTSLSSLPMGEAVSVTTPNGRKILLTKTGEGLRAFYSRCPHLGCQVFWRVQNQEFHCPCHEGYFDAAGVATAGPPAKEGQNLRAVDTQVEGDSVFAWV